MTTPLSIKAVIRTGDSSGYVAECLELPVVTQGKTLDETVVNLREAVELHLENEARPATDKTVFTLAIEYEEDPPAELDSTNEPLFRADFPLIRGKLPSMITSEGVREALHQLEMEEDLRHGGMGSREDS